MGTIGRFKPKSYVLALITVSLFAAENREVLLYTDKGYIKFTKEAARNLNYVGDEESYIRYGKRYISNGTLLVRFKSKPEDLEQFCKENGIELVKVLSTGTYIFRNIDGVDIVEKSNEIYKLENVSYSSPNWRRERVLY